MSMSFYDALQLDPAALKARIRASESQREKNFFRLALLSRALLLVGFAILFIGAGTSLFGAENSPMAVVLFCMLLSIRFVNFSYCIRDSLLALAASLAVLLLAPGLAARASAALVAPIHLAAAFSLLFMTAQQPELGNGGLYSFAYIYLVGNPVFGEALIRRVLLTLTGCIICAAVLILKHRSAHSAIRFHHILRNFSLSNAAHLWQLRMALAISLILTLGRVLQIERFMWMGFACTSILSAYPYSGRVTPRFLQRFFGVLTGSAAFFILFQATPEAFHSLLAPLGGILLGFCTNYLAKTIMNCFGALSLGAAIYGLQGAVLLRVWDTVLGVLFSLIFAFVFEKLAAIGRAHKKTTGSA